MNYHVFLVSLGYKVSPAFSVHGDLTYTVSEGSFDSVVFSGIDPEAFTALVDTGLWDYDFSKVNELSDLDITNYEMTFGADYLFSDNASFYASISYAKWEDNEWVLEDNTGDYTVGSFGVFFKF